MGKYPYKILKGNAILALPVCNKVSLIEDIFWKPLLSPYEDDYWLVLERKRKNSTNTQENDVIKLTFRYIKY